MTGQKISELISVMAAHVDRPLVRLVRMQRAAEDEAAMAVAGASVIIVHKMNPKILKIAVFGNVSSYPLSLFVTANIEDG